MKTFSLASLTLMMLLICCISAPLHAQDRLLGAIDFPNSGTRKAQPFFIQGVRFLHNFEYEDAASAFRKAQIADPEFALAYWGEAISHNHPIWMQQDRGAAMAILERLGSSAEDRQAKAATVREKDFLMALETLYGNTPASAGKTKEERDDLYSEAMQRLYEKYPRDDEVAAFYALSILGTAHEGRNFAISMRAASVLQTIWEKNNLHPGAAHYLIHSYDDPIHAPMGLPMAEAYAEIAPDASHAQHMTSHIFVALGMWDDVVRVNEVALDVQNKRLAELGKREVVCGHYTFWLQYGYLQQGRYEEAEKVLNTCFDRVSDNPSNGERLHFSVMRARYILDTQNWASIEKWRAPNDVSMDEYEAYLFTNAFANINLGKLRDAEDSMQRLRDLGLQEGSAQVLHLGLEALYALHNGNEEEALGAIKKATSIEAELPSEFGPPPISKPSFELLGDMYMTLMKYEDAVEAYRNQLNQTPVRAASLLGLARASQEAGYVIEAQKAYEQLADIWHLADAGIPGYKDVIMSQ